MRRWWKGRPTEPEGTEPEGVGRDGPEPEGAAPDPSPGPVTAPAPESAPEPATAPAVTSPEAEPADEAFPETTPPDAAHPDTAPPDAAHPDTARPAETEATPAEAETAAPPAAEAPPEADTAAAPPEAEPSAARPGKAAAPARTTGNGKKTGKGTGAGKGNGTGKSGTSRRRAKVPEGPWPRPPRTRVIAVANQKGGCAKTTSTVNLAAALTQAGLAVLVLDLDPQGNASSALSVPHTVGVPSLYDVVVDRRPLAETVVTCPDLPGLLAAPATIDLAGADLELITAVNREQRLRDSLQEYLATRDGDERIDYVLIDCPPSLSLLTVNAFTAAGEVLIPVQCEYYALEGLSQLLGHIDLVRNHLNPQLQISSLLLTMYDSRTRLSSQVADEVRTHFPDRVANTVIPRSVRISEAPSHGQTVLTYDPANIGSRRYREAAYELATRLTVD
jgi:chromosome partitioning protein